MNKQPQAVSKSPRRPKKRKAVFYLLSFLIVFGLGAWVSRQVDFDFAFRQNTNQLTPRTEMQKDGNTVMTGEENTLASVAEKVSPSVVSIVTRTVDMTYFGPSEQQGAGTGVIVGKDGYVMTNKHVVKDASTVTVVMSDGTQYEKVKVLGSDPLNDVAFLKIDGVSDLPAVELGDSTTVRVGQSVIAIGNSLGQYQNTVTKGIISGTGRPITASDGSGARGSSENLTDLLQTDAAINPGNSGGPLLNSSGQMIGINTAVAANAEGIGFAIPVNATKGMLKQVLAGKSVERAYLGIQTLPVTPSVAKQYELPVKQGAYVFRPNGGSAVLTNSPADKAGLRDKDIIVAVNGVEVGSKGSVSTLVGEYSAGDTVELKVLRGGREQTLRATLDAYPAQM